MSGHSKWSTIKRKKGAKDAKRSKIFSRIVKEITIAIKEGSSSDPDSNPRLRLAIANAKGVNMPKNNIVRAIKKAESDDSNLNEITFEGVGPRGIAIFVECLTDNNQRTVSDVRHIFTKYGGNLGKNGSLSYLFERKGIFVINNGDFDMEELELDLIDVGLEDIEKVDDKYFLTVEMVDFGNMQKKLEELELEVENAELQRIAQNYKSFDKETTIKVLNVIDKFEQLDDVQNVFHNIEITDEVAEEIDN